MPERTELLDQERRQSANVFVDIPHPDRLEQIESRTKRGQRGEAHRPVLERFRSALQLVRVQLYRRDLDRPAGEPGAVQPLERGVASDQGANPGWVAEHLVERERHEIGRDRAKRQTMCGHVGCGIQQHVIPELLRGAHQAKRVVSAGKVGLGREGEQTGRPSA
jgi:hypothetical protein